MRSRRISTASRTRPESSACSARRRSCSRKAGDPLATRGFNEIARLTGGACCRFDTGSAEQLRALLRAVAAFAAGGRAALTSLPGSAAKQLAGQMKALPGGGRGKRR